MRKILLQRGQISKTTLLAAAAFVVFGGIVGWQWYQEQRQETTTQSNKDFVSFDTSAVTDITIVHGETTTTLQKQTDQSNQWVVLSQASVAADAAAIEALLNTLNTALIQATVSTGTEAVAGSAREAAYGLTGSDQVHITVSANGSVVADVDVGKVGSAARTWYGRTTGEPTIYLLSGSQASLTKPEWTAPPAADNETLLPESE